MMRSIKLSCGKSKIPFDYDDERFDVLGASRVSLPLTDRELGAIIDSPFGSKSIEEIVGPNETVLIAVPDATRDIGAGQITNLLVRRLIAAGSMPYEIGIIFATGLHRPVTPSERLSILTPFIEQRVKAFDHNASDLSSFLNLGETKSGIAVELNRKLVEADHVILIGGVGFHYFAGFTGGRKLVCPGLASKRTIVGTHGLAFDALTRSRADGVGPGLLDDNPVHEAFIEASEMVAPAFTFNTLVDDRGSITDMVCGHWKLSHAEACRRYLNDHTLAVPEKRALVIVTCGGYPLDINMVQAHKAIEMASRACSEGGTIVVLAECADGAGSEEFAKWFDYGDSSGLAKRLGEKYAIGGQTAWSLLQKAEKFEINIVTKLDNVMARKMGLNWFPDFARALSESKPAESGYILPFGAKYLPELE